MEFDLETFLLATPSSKNEVVLELAGGMRWSLLLSIAGCLFRSRTRWLLRSRARWLLRSRRLQVLADLARLLADAIVSVVLVAGVLLFFMMSFDEERGKGKVSSVQVQTVPVLYTSSYCTVVTFFSFSRMFLKFKKWVHLQKPKDWCHLRMESRCH